MWHLAVVLLRATPWTVCHFGRKRQALPNVVRLFVLMFGGAWLLLEFVRLLHLCAQICVDAQSLCLRISLEIRRALSLS